RAMRGFLGLELDAPRYRVEEGEWRVEVPETVEVRPRIAAAVVKGLELDDARLRSLMKLQENVHWALGRDRKLASIGVYDLARVAGPRLAYRGVAPDGVSFVPLGFAPGVPDSELTPREILERHPKGVAFARLLAESHRLPLLVDANDDVLSMPPIINSEATRVSTATTGVVVDVTGMEDRLVDRALNIVVTSLLETCRGSHVETCEIRYAGEASRLTPALGPQVVDLDAASASRIVGVSWAAGELAELLRRMRHDATVVDETRVRVEVPAWRADVLHPRDLMEDAAIAYGYDRMPEAGLGASTIAAPSATEARADVARSALVGLGCLEVLTLALSSEDAAYGRAGIADEGRQVRLQNPISTEQTMVRVSLLPGLLETLAVNLGHPFPQRIFEVGPVTLLDDESETGARETLRAAIALSGDGIGYAEVRGIVEALLAEVHGGPQQVFTFAPSAEGIFLAGRGAALGGGGGPLGRLGEVAPQVLERYRIVHPVAVAEIDLDAVSRLSI
ncbi:MAG: phenylalanine--tRNA ligase subunit beta, partial [Acidobacteriota bacterium]|nr:phenylalanine--tRNA ligase subunit beta [Acidobacteriota bacterium]